MWSEEEEEVLDFDQNPDSIRPSRSQRINMVKHINIGQFRFDLGLITVEPVLFLYMFSNFLYFPTLQSLIFDKICLSKFTGTFCEKLKCNSTFKDDHKSQYHEVNSDASHWILNTTTAMTVPSFVIVILFLGALGDRINRKIPVILPCVGALLSYISGMLNAHFMSASLYYILIGPILNGFCGGFIACLMAVYSYIGHIASSQSKMTRVGILESMVFLAGTIGVFVSGIMLERKGYIFVFSVSSVAIAIALIYSVLWLDSLTPLDIRQGGGCCNWIGTFLKESFRCVSKRRPGRTIMAIALQVITIDILMLCTSGDMDISLLYLRESLDFSQTLFGYYKGLDNFLRGIVMITVLPLVKRFIDVKNLPLVLVGLISSAGSFIVLGVATEKWMPFLAAVVGMLKSLSSAGLRATMSSMVSGDEQGRLFGLIAASESLITLVASVLFNELFPATYNVYHGLIYLLAACLVMVSFFMILYLTCTLVDETAETQQYHPFLNDGESDQLPTNTTIGEVQNDEMS